MSARAGRIGLVVVAVLLLASCAAGANDLVNTAPAGGADVAGFWQGLWHGLISPITFIVSLLTDDVNIYEVHNDGGWYDFGFMAGVSIFFGGGAGSGRAGSRRRSGR